MSEIKSTHLIVNDDGSVYHLKLKPGEIATTIILVGDPDRVAMVSSKFDDIELVRQSREFITHTGHYNGFRLSVISTGIGTDNIDIVLNEIDALHNIDFKTKKVKTNITTLDFIRIGTTGSIQEDIVVGSFLVNSKAVGFDALGYYYATPQNPHRLDETNAFVYKLSTLIPTENTPYLCEASDKLMDKVDGDFVVGIAATMPGFYAAQCRVLRAPSKLSKDVVSFLAAQEWHGERFSNIEMETAGIYLLASALGHDAISFNAVLANRITDVFSPESEKTVESLIDKVLGLYFG